MAFERFNNLSNEYEVAPEFEDVRGFDVFDSNGDHIGEVQDLLVNTDNYEINYALIGRGWLASMFGNRELIVPMKKMDIDSEDQSIHLDMSKEMLQNFPSYSALNEPDLPQRVDEFWGGSMYQRPIEGRERYGRATTIPVVEERARVSKTMEQAGEVVVHMEEEVMQQPITEEIHGERVEVHREKIAEQPLSEFEKEATSLQPGESISIPVTEERIRITKEPVVTEVIRLQKIPTSRQVTAQEELHKEHVEIEEKGMHGTEEDVA